MSVVELRLGLKEADGEAVDVFEAGPLRETLGLRVGVLLTPDDLLWLVLPVELLLVVTEPVIVFETVDVFVEVGLVVVVLERAVVCVRAEEVEGVFVAYEVGV